MINSGLKRENTISSVCFNLVLESVIRIMPRIETLNHDNESILLAYVDYIVVIGNSRD